MAAPSFETILWSREGSIATVTINRPKVLNALNQQVIQDLLAVLNNPELTIGLRALVITGAGDKAFVAGADIAAMKDLSAAQALQFARLGQTLTCQLEASPFLTIAKVHGYALGGGCELALACDLIIASEQAIFGQPEVDLGIIPGFGGTQRLARRIGLPLALEVLCAGRKLSGIEAQQSGLVAVVASAADLDASLAKILKNLCRAAPSAIAETKKLARASLEQPLSHGLAAEASAFAACFSGPEAKEGINAFLEKRKATFSN